MSNDTKHFLIRVTEGEPEVIDVFDSYGSAIDAWKARDDQRLAEGIPMNERYYAVREHDSLDYMVRMAVENAKLTPKQRTVLIQINDHLRRTWRRSVRPGLDPSWKGMYSGDLVDPAQGLAKKGLVAVEGVPYGPKTYRITRKGAALAEAYKVLGFTGKSNWDREAKKHVYA